MERNYFIASGLIVLLAITMFMAGCSSSSSTTTSQAAVTGTATQAAASAPLYSTGDIVKNPKSTVAVGILIISYDVGTDMYERATIYPNSDGSWGYRTDAKTETISRTTLEKVYTEKITNKAVSAIPTKAPVITVATTPVTTTSSSTTATTSTTSSTETTTTSSSTLAPSISDITPDSGYAGTSVAITELKGYNFVTGATVKLVKSDGTDIPATDVTIVSISDITCTFPIPSDATVGSWNIVIKNQDGYSGTYTNGFLVRKNSSATTTTTTTTTSSSTSTGNITVTGISPSTYPSNSHSSYTVTGTNFVVGATVKLTSSSHPDISQFMISSTTPTSITVWFDIPQSWTGSYNVVVTNPDGTYGTLNNGLSINS
jgi:hypothetical protein